MKLTAGNYYIGDPTDVLKEKYLEEYYDKVNRSVEGYFDIDGVMVFASNTFYEGKGTYLDNNRTYDVQIKSGTLGAIPIDEKLIQTPGNASNQGGFVVGFPHDFKCNSVDSEGEILIGSLLFLTGPDEEDYYDDEYEEE